MYIMTYKNLLANLTVILSSHALVCVQLSYYKARLKCNTRS